MKKILSIIVPVLICFAIGFTASYFQKDSIENWYPYLNKPMLTPPNMLFPIAWSVLYLLMGLSIGLIIINMQKPLRTFFIKLFAIQLFFNFTWSITFFYMQNPLLGLVNIIILDILVAYYIIKTYPHARISSILFIPYLLWICFATYLNTYIFIYN